jgi:hypothetical protein
MAAEGLSYGAGSGIQRSMSQRFPVPASSLRAFAIVRSDTRLMARAWLPPVRRVDPLDPNAQGFCLAMNRANCLAYDGQVSPAAASTALGMPLWVFLDCCALPSAIVGYEAPASVLPSWYRDAIDPEGHEAYLPVTEYIALPSLNPRECVGVSLFSFVEGGNWGRRTKALALTLLGARSQLGVAQYTNASLRLHLAFGELELRTLQTAVHSRPSETFVYQVVVPPARQLRAMLETGKAIARRPLPPFSEAHSFDPRVPSEVAAWCALGAGRRAWLVGARLDEDGQVEQVDVRLDPVGAG